VLAWAGVIWDKDHPETARYRCEACEVLIENWHKTDMLTRGEWRATAAGDGKTRGYHISALYAPVGWPSWGELAAEFLGEGDARVLEQRRSSGGNGTAETFRNRLKRACERHKIAARVVRKTNGCRTPL